MLVKKLEKTPTRTWTSCNSSLLWSTAPSVETKRCWIFIRDFARQTRKLSKPICRKLAISPRTLGGLVQAGRYVTGVSLAKEDLRGFQFNRIIKVNSLHCYYCPVPMDHAMWFCTPISTKGQKLAPWTKCKRNPTKRSKTSGMFQVRITTLYAWLPNLSMPLLWSKSQAFGLRQKWSKNVLCQMQEQVPQSRRALQIRTRQPEA